MAQKIRLVGCERYNFRGELYEKGKVYMVGDTKAELMLRAEDDYGRPYFAPYVKPVKSAAQRAAEAAAKAAREAEAEEEAEVVERPDGSEPADSVPAEEAVDEDAAVEVDTDDDPDLDEDDEPNPEEVEDEEDRDDGSAVTV